jgi:hypothetical protein
MAEEIRAFTTPLFDKLAGIEDGAEVNVQSDWNQTDTGADDYIKNKPAAGTGDVVGPASSTDNGVAIYNGTTGKIIKTTTATITPTGDISVSNVIVTGNVDGRDVSVDGLKLDGIDPGAEVNVNSDWNASSGDAEILNKPTDLTDLSTHSVTELNDVTSAGSGAIITTVERSLLGNQSGTNTGDVTLASDDTTQETLDLTGQELSVDLATTTTDGAMAATDKDKLDGIDPGAEVNNISDVNATDLTDGGESTLHYHASDRDRANHTGTQTASTISDFDTEVSNNVSVTANTAKVSFPEAPIDGDAYARKNAGWEAINGGGDMLKATYDPTSINSDAFARANHTGTQTVSTISDFDTEVTNNVSVTANTAKVSADGSVTTHSDVTDAGSGAIITTVERSLLGNQSGTNTGDVTLDAGDTTQETLDLTLQQLTVNLATTTTDGAMAATDKDKLDNIEAGAEVNNISDVNATDLTDGGDTTLHYHSEDRDRANHTGTQTASTISDFDTEVSNNTAVAANTAKVTNATHTGEVTGSGALTVDSTAISNKTLNSTPAGTEEVLINNAGTLQKTTTQAIADLGSGGTVGNSIELVKNGIFNAGSYAVMGEVTTGPAHGFIVPKSMSIEYVTISRSDVDSANVEILRNGSVVATVNTAALNIVDSSMSIACVAGDVIVAKNADTGTNTMLDVIISIWFE